MESHRKHRFFGMQPRFQVGVPEAAEGVEKVVAGHSC